MPPAPAFPPPMNAAEIQLALQKLNVLGRVLYVAAHPDDENTNLMALWANGSLYEAGYLCVTRGDGGQNLIGPELRRKARRHPHAGASGRAPARSRPAILHPRGRFRFLEKRRRRRCGFGIATRSSRTSSGSSADFARMLSSRVSVRTMTRRTDITPPRRFSRAKLFRRPAIRSVFRNSWLSSKSGNRCAWFGIRRRSFSRIATFLSIQLVWPRSRPADSVRFSARRLPRSPRPA